MRWLRASLYYLLLAVLASCATPPPLAEEKMRELSLSEFLAARFSGGQSESVRDTIRYTAYFNKSDYYQLERPTLEIARFCKASSGQLINISPYQGDPVGRFFYTAAAVIGKTYHRHPEVVFDETESLITRYGAEEAFYSYNSVKYKNRFGTLECRYDQAGRQNWSVSVLPIGFLPRSPDGNMLQPHKMVIEIRPLKS